MIRVASSSIAGASAVPRIPSNDEQVPLSDCGVQLASSQITILHDPSRKMFCKTWQIQRFPFQEPFQPTKIRYPNASTGAARSRCNRILS